MSSRRAATAAAIALLAALAAAGAPAPAVAGPFPAGAAIASASFERREQGDDSTIFVTISQNGRYVVFDTRATNFYRDDDPDPSGFVRGGGVFRRDNASGELAKVADGDLIADADGALARRGAHGPSVSADGRYVAFSSAERLVAADQNDNVDVYRRDMDMTEDAAGAYVLVSAKDGGDQPASYAPRTLPLPGRNPGTEVFGGRALSADGNRVVLRTVEAASDLPDRTATDVPGGQLLVRDIAERETRLLTRSSEDGGPTGGATGAAALSADGKAVAWVGSNAPAQTRFLAGEQANASANFYLYRRLDDRSAPTRRITGIADLDDPACDGGAVGSDPTETGPCYGPLADSEQGRGDISQRAPALSADGYTVAFVAAAAGRPASINNPGLDLFVTDMRPGVSRKTGTRELTREGDPGDPTQSAPIESVTIAADGVHAAVTTLRSRFVLRALTPFGTAFRTQPDAREIYAIDLATGTLERVVRGSNGADASGDAGDNVALSGDGATLAFTSAAGNLFFGDANEKSDAFLLSRETDVPTTAPPPPRPPVAQAFESVTEPTGPRLGVRVARRRDGALALTVRTPGAGRMIALARSGKPLRTVARVTRDVGTKGLVTAILRVRGKDRTRLRAKRRLAAVIRVRFVSKDPAARALSRVVKTSFRYSIAGKRKPVAGRRRPPAARGAR